MRQRSLGLLVVVSIMGAVVALSTPKDSNLLLLEWAAKAQDEPPPAAVLIELGLTDTKPKTWSGQATLTGAKVVHREGYGFRDADKLVGADAWTAASHRPLRVPQNPAVIRMAGIIPVGIVLHLADIKQDASLALTVAGSKPEKVEVALKDVLAGQPKKVLDGAVRVRRISAAQPITRSQAENDFPAAAYGPDGTLWVAYIGYHLVEESRRIEVPSLKAQPTNFRSYDTPTFGDQLFVQYSRAGKWSKPIAVTGAREDLVRCAIAVEKDGTAWTVTSANRAGKYQLVARSIRAGTGPDAPAQLGSEEVLYKSGSGALSPVLATDQAGNLACSFQLWSDGGDSTVELIRRSKGQWTAGPFQDPAPQREGAPRVARWHPAIACGPDGRVAFGHDDYRGGDYDVRVAVRNGQATDSFDVAASARFEARPSLCYDAHGRLWIAYEEAPEGWGKDYGALSPKKGEPLYSQRSVRVVCLQDGKLFTPAAALPTAPSSAPKFPYDSPNEFTRFEHLPRYSNPALGLDGMGRLWLTYRQKFGDRTSSNAGSYWLSFARRLDGDHWTDPIELHHSDATLDCLPVLLPHPSGGLRVIHNGDGRWTLPATLHNQVYESFLDLPGEPIEPKLVAHEPGKKDDAAAKKERDEVRRIRDYRVEAAGKQYRLLRGEFHRHTEISWDGGCDGSLEDMFRYAIDAVAFDWIANADHDNGAGREYGWWLTQKLTDAYHVGNHFTPLFGYERSVSYPHGHRNCLFTRRGIRTLPRLQAEDDPDPKAWVPAVHADDTKMFYRYLHELGGICASHTSATSMGTDWRDNDPVVEPLVEIYQGDRMSYEMEKAPRAGYDPKTKTFPPNIAGWYPKGYINLALAKGYRLGFQASSDHWSTHISFCIVLAERHDRAAIVDGMRRRHCYAATDNIVLDVRSGAHVMGDEWKSQEAPKLQIRVLGTAPLAKVEVLKDSEVVKTFQSKQSDLREEWTDPKPTAGVHYYYLRVQQSDGELAWGSPVWIDYQR
jgi:hypothetical protein